MFRTRKFYFKRNLFKLLDSAPPSVGVSQSGGGPSSEAEGAARPAPSSVGVAQTGGGPSSEDEGAASSDDEVQILQVFPFSPSPQSREVLEPANPLGSQASVASSVGIFHWNGKRLSPLIFK